MNRMSHPILLAIVWQSPLPKIMDCRVGGGLQEMWCCLCLGLNLFGHLLISFFYFSYLSWSNLSVVTAMFLPICFDHLLMSFISVSVDYISLATAISCWFFETIFFFSFLSQISFLRLWPSFLLTCFTIFRFLFLSGLPSSSHLSCWLFFTFFLSRVPFWGHGHLSRWLLTTQNLRPAFTPAYLSSLFGPFFFSLYPTFLWPFSTSKPGSQADLFFPQPLASRPDLSGWMLEANSEAVFLVCAKAMVTIANFVTSSPKCTSPITLYTDCTRLYYIAKNNQTAKDNMAKLGSVWSNGRKKTPLPPHNQKSTLTELVSS